MANRAKHAFGSLSDVQAALDSGKINAYDILFLDGDTEPKVGWIDKNGVFRLVENVADISGIESEIDALEAELAGKANSEEVDALESQISGKVGAEEVEMMIDTKISEVNSAYEVVEF